MRVTSGANGLKGSVHIWHVCRHIILGDVVSSCTTQSGTRLSNALKRSCCFILPFYFCGIFEEEDTSGNLHGLSLKRRHVQYLSATEYIRQ